MVATTALREFTEKYPPVAISYLEAMSGDLSLQMHTFPAISLTEGASKFTEYMTGYAEYKRENTDQELSNDKLLEHTHNYVRGDLFEEVKLPYSSAATFVSDYLSHLVDLEKLTEVTQGNLIEADMSAESVGLVVEMVDDYVTYLVESMVPVIDKLLLASGYTSAKRLAEAQPRKKKQEYYL